MTKIIDFALSRAKTTMMLAVLIVVAGSYARQEIPIAASPNIQLPFVSVSVFLDGASPSDGSRLVAKPLENRLNLIFRKKQKILKSENIQMLIFRL
jgi:multidrug efflux pump